MKRGVTLFFLFYCSLSFSQKQYVGIIQTGSGQLVAGCTLRVLNTDVATVSSAAGLFELPSLPTGEYLLEASSIGMATTNISVRFPVTDTIRIVMASSFTRLGTVVVTAEKKESDILRVPISITAFSSRDVEAYRLWATKDLKGTVSNLYSGDPGDGRTVTSIRGIVSTSYDPAVVTYVDGVPQFTLDTYIPQLFDIDHIDVLKGPQGTLYGRNALGGVINIVTKQPAGFNLDAQFSYGNYNQHRLTVSGNFPFTKKLILGVSYLNEGMDGYFINDYDNSHFDRQHRNGGIASLRYLLNAQWSFSLNAKFLSNYNWGAFPLNLSSVDRDKNPYHVNQNAVGEMKDNTANYSFLIRHTGAKVDFSSLTAYQSNYRYYENPLDGDFTPYDVISIANNYGKPWNKVGAWTEELRLSSATGSESRLKWAAGAYLFYQDVPTQQGVHFGKDAAFAGSPDSNYTVVSRTTAKNRGLAFYGQADYALTKQWVLSGGLRYDFQHSYEEVAGEYIPDGSTGFPTQPDTSGTSDYHAFTPMVSILYKLNAEASLYAAYRRGYRTGGLTQLSTDPSQPPLYPYQPEYSNNYEIGMKSILYEGRLQTNLSVFYTQVQDVQIPTLVLPDAITVIRNGGSLSSFGFEMETEGLLAKGLRATWRFGYTHAEYTGGQVSVNGSEVDLNGKHQVFTPDITSLLAIQYDRLLNREGTLSGFLRWEWTYFGTQYFNLANDLYQNSYGLLNASAGCTYHQFGLSLWFRNITGAKYVAYAYDFGAMREGDPFVFGATLRVSVH